MCVAAVPCLPRLNEIRVLKVRLADMRRELHVLRTGVANVDVLKREVSLGGLALRTAAKRQTVLRSARKMFKLQNPAQNAHWLANQPRRMSCSVLP